MTAAKAPYAGPLFNPIALRNGLLSLLFATAICGILMLSRQWYVGAMRYSFLFVNLCLAWIPMALACVLLRLESFRSLRFLFWFCAICWFFFFPNSSYIITDIVHIKKFGQDDVPKWFDFLMTMAHACTGLFLGCFSLYITQVIVASKLGKRAGWYFSVTMLTLAAFGIFLGRFFRLNSWDVLMKPYKITSELGRFLNESTFAEMMAFTVTFFLFSAAAYCVFLSVAQLNRKDNEGPIEALIPPEICRTAASPFNPALLRNSIPALILATLVCGLMVLSRWWYTGEIRFRGFFGNLLLAWIPMGLALVLLKLESYRRKWLFWCCAICWVLFFPNAKYIITDIVHVKKFGQDDVPKWFDFIMTISHACIGLLLGCFSLYLMQCLVRTRIGRRAGWYFSLTMLGLASFGIFLGRFFRLNSWDVLTRPQKLIHELGRLQQEETLAEMMAFTVTFSLFSIAAYCIFVSVAQLHRPEKTPTLG